MQRDLPGPQASQKEKQFWQRTSSAPKKSRKRPTREASKPAPETDDWDEYAYGFDYDDSEYEDYEAYEPD